MTESTHAWIWATLERMATLAEQQEEAETEAKRLAAEYAAEQARVLEAVPGLSIDAAVDAIRLIGAPVVAAAETRVPVSQAAGDPLDIPSFLKRGEKAGEDDDQPKRAGDDEALAAAP